MSVCKKNSKNNLRLLEEIDDVMMESWSQGFSLGDAIDTMPNYLREAFLKYSFGTPLKTDDGSYVITLRP